MVTIGRFSYLIRIILPVALTLLIAPLSGCSKMTWTLGGTKEIDEERVAQTVDEKNLKSSQEKEDLQGEGRIPVRDGQINREAADVTKTSNLSIRSDLRKENDIEDIHFDFNKFIIQDDYMEIVKKDAEWLSSNPNIKVVIEGQADERGTTEYNLALGERRAQAVKKHLIAIGIDPLRVSTISYGEEKPVCTEHTEECWWKNRRAHFAVNK